MTIIWKPFLLCDGPGCWQHLEGNGGDSGAHMRKRAVADGWAYRYGLLFCPSVEQVAQDLSGQETRRWTDLGCTTTVLSYHRPLFIGGPGTGYTADCVCRGLPVQRFRYRRDAVQHWLGHVPDQGPRR
ncbi:hypothetical protein ACFFMN_23785 [Planobispora siamensis]|uniref:Uncharacterized protein n=1 Tax=Planobispora siamensis TaxID=936338 RepID=A0A8J3WP92_9ACTN|nr:hypothetical protein [Planobispora siamensis]GIH95372.1 hypothetical protein Psi01_60020 [Planobispora siamensis]